MTDTGHVTAGYDERAETMSRFHGEQHEDSLDPEQVTDRYEGLCSHVQVSSCRSIDCTYFSILHKTQERTTQKAAISTASLDGARRTRARNCTTSPSSSALRGSADSGVWAGNCLRKREDCVQGGHRAWPAFQQHVPEKAVASQNDAEEGQ